MKDQKQNPFTDKKAPQSGIRDDDRREGEDRKLGGKHDDTKTGPIPGAKPGEGKSGQKHAKGKDQPSHR